MHSFPPAGRVGEYLRCSPADIEWALSVQAAELASGNVKRLGEILVEREQISLEELDAALKAQCIARLRQCPLFSALPHADLDRISEIAEEVRLRAGEDILEQGHRGDSMYVVASDGVMIYQRHADREWVELGMARPSDILGEMGYFSDGTRSYSACALKPAVLLRLRYDLLSNVIQLIPDLAVEFLNLVTARMRECDFHCDDSLVPAR